MSKGWTAHAEKGEEMESNRQSTESHGTGGVVYAPPKLEEVPLPLLAGAGRCYNLNQCDSALYGCG